MRRTPSPIARPLSIDLQSRTGHRVTTAASHETAEAEPVLLLRGGMWQCEMDKTEARRLCRFIEAWWPED
jgi:hypothetical protein